MPQTAEPTRSHLGTGLLSGYLENHMNINRVLTVMECLLWECTSGRILSSEVSAKPNVPYR